MSSTDQVALVGIADPVGDQTGNIDKSLIVSSVDELIERKLDLAVVACPTMHEQVALQLCEAGVHVLVEKPLRWIWGGKRIASAFDDAN